jgi:hypothetical protein
MHWQWTPMGLLLSIVAMSRAISNAQQKKAGLSVQPICL